MRMRVRRRIYYTVWADPPEGPRIERRPGSWKKAARVAIGYAQRGYSNVLIDTIYEEKHKNGYRTGTWSRALPDGRIVAA